MSHANAAPALHLAWTTFQRRQVSMAPLAGFECVFMPLAYGGRSKVMKGLHYLGHFFKTVSLLRARRPPTVWVQLPQVPLLWVALVYRLLFNRQAKVVADCHNAMFKPPWSKVPLGLSLLQRCDLILVHNDAVRATALALGLPATRTLVLEDVPPAPMARGTGAEPAAFAGRPRPWVLFPGSFSADEPVGELLQAARLLASGTVVMTGKTANAARHGHDISQVPANVVMPGYLSVEDFDALLMHCDLVLALTRFDGIQLSVCNEALGYGKPMVVSDTSLLRALFADAAVMAPPDNPAALAQAIRLATADADRLARASTALAAQRRQAWLDDQYHQCQAALHVC